MSSGKFKELKAYLKALPENLPVSGPTSKLNRLLEFVLDKDWVNDAGVEGAVNCEIKVALGDFLPQNNDGIFYIKERGLGIEALVDVLEYIMVQGVCCQDLLSYNYGLTMRLHW